MKRKHYIIGIIILIPLILVVKNWGRYEIVSGRISTSGFSMDLDSWGVHLKPTDNELNGYIYLNGVKINYYSGLHNQLKVLSTFAVHDSKIENSFKHTLLVSDTKQTCHLVIEEIVSSNDTLQQYVAMHFVTDDFRNKNKQRVLDLFNSIKLNH